MGESLLRRLRWTTVASWILGIIGVKRLASRILRSRRGVLSAVLVWCSLYGVAAASVLFTVDFPLSVAVVWALDALLRCDGFRRRGASLRVGLLIGTALLVKAVAFVFLAPAALATLVAAGRSPRFRTALANAGIAGAVAIVIAGPWYWSNLDIMRGYAGQMSGGGFHNLWVRNADWSWHLATMAASTVGLVVLAGFASGVVVACARRGEARVLALHAVVALVAFSALSYKEPQYLVPVMPAIAILAVLPIERLPARFRRPVGAVAAVVMLVQGIHVTGIAPLEVSRAFGVLPDGSADVSRPTPFGASRRPAVSDGGMARLTDLLRELSAGRASRIFVATAHPPLDGFLMAMLAEDRRLPWRVAVPGYDLSRFGEISSPLDRPGGSDPGRESARQALPVPAGDPEALLEADFVVVSGFPSGSAGERKARRPSLIAEVTNLYLQDPVHPLVAEFQRFASFRATNGMLVSILRPHRPAMDHAAIRDHARFLRDHWPGRGDWARVLSRVAPEGSPERLALRRLGNALDSRSGGDLAVALAGVGVSALAGETWVGDFEILAIARSGRFDEARGRFGSDRPRNLWVAVEVLLGAGRPAEARSRVLERVSAEPDDLQAAEFLRTSGDIDAVLRDVPARAISFLVAPAVGGGAITGLIDAGFGAFAEGAWRRGLHALRCAHLSTVHAEAVIRARLRSDLPGHPLVDRVLDSEDLLLGLDEAAREIERLVEADRARR